MPTKKRRRDRFAQIPREVIYSDAFQTLTGKAPHMLLMAACQYVSKDSNGNISLPYTKYREFGFVSRNTMERSIAQLIEHGLLVVTRQGGRTSQRLPSLYALGWLPITKDDRLDISTPCGPPGSWREFRKD